MVFNIFSNNRDDHVKNFAFIINHKGEWALSPAYDLIYSHGPGGEHSMTILGEGKAPGKADIYKLGEKHGIKKQVMDHIVEQVSDAVNRFLTYAEAAGVSKSTRNKIYAGICRNQVNRGGCW